MIAKRCKTALESFADRFELPFRAVSVKLADDQGRVDREGFTQIILEQFVTCFFIDDPDKCV